MEVVFPLSNCVGPISKPASVPAAMFVQNNKFAQVFIMDSDSVGPVVIETIGNTWNPRAQMADDNGHYDSSMNPVRGPIRGDNYDLEANNLSIDL
jgi:hypothetical protein